MTSFINASRTTTRRLSRWVRRTRRSRQLPALVLVAVLGSGALAVSCTSSDATKPAAERAPVPVRVVKATKGDIAVTLAYSGELKAVDTVDMVPSATGRIEDVMVDEGAEVTAGMPLARQETDALNAQLKQAQATLASSQARLETILVGARPEDVAAARAALEAVRQRLQTMLNGSRTEELAAASAQNLSARAQGTSARSKLADLEAGSKPADLAAAQAAVDTAAANLARDEAKYRLLINPSELDVQSGQAAVDSARASVTSAQAKLDDLKAQPKLADKSTAEAAVAASQSALRAAELAYAAKVAPLNDEKLKKLITAYLELNKARSELADGLARQLPADQLQALESAVKIALERLQAVEKDVGTFVIGVRPEDVVALQAAVDAARSNVKRDQDKLAQTIAGATAQDLQAAQAAFDQARSNMQAAQLKLTRLLQPTDADIQTAKAAADGSRASLTSTTEKLNQLKAGATAADLEAARASIAAADSAAAAADSSLAKARAPFTDPELLVQQALVTQSEQQASKAETPFLKPDIDAAVATVASSQATVEVAQINLNRATIVAPFDAIVVKKLVSKGATVTTGTPIVSLVSKETQVVFNVEEASIGRLQEGQRVAFTVAAFGDKAFTGNIVSISPTADAASRTFRVRTNMTGNIQGLRGGMFANVNVTVQERKGVIVVPTDALVPQGADNFVLVAKDNTAERKKVTIGLRNDQTVEIRDGLQEGDQVVTRGNRTPLRPDDKIVIVP